MYLNAVGITREELLENIVYDYVYAKSTYTNTLLGEPKEITRIRGILDGVCMALALEYEIKNLNIVFKTIGSKKLILELQFDPEQPF